MVEYDKNADALTLGDDDSIAVGDYELKYSSTDDEWQAEYGRPIGGDVGAHGDILGGSYSKNSAVGDNSIFLDESNDRIETTFVDNSTNSVTVSAWIYPTTFNSGSFTHTIIDAGEETKYIFRGGELNGSNVVDLAIHVGGSQYSLFDGNGTFGGDIPLNQWSHVAGTYDGTTRKVYLNGTEVLSDTSASGDFTSPSTDVLSQIGKDINTNERDWSGGLDELLVYNRALSASEISDLSNKTLITSGLQARWGFEYPETPNIAIDSTGDIFPKNAIPRSTSGSLVPEGFADVLSNGEVLADNGEIYTSVQTAVDNSTGFVFVGPGTFNENVTISTEGLTLEGVGDNSTIEGTEGSTLTVNADNATIRNLSVNIIASSTSFPNCILYNGLRGVVDSVGFGATVSNDSATFGVSGKSGGVGLIVKNCLIDSPELNIAIAPDDESIVTNNIILNGGVGIGLRSDGVVANNIISNMSKQGVISGTSSRTDNIVIGNRIIDCSDAGIRTFGADTIIANNRVSGSGSGDIDDQGTGTVLDGNLTGASN
jgi:hypothetical protein